MSDMHSIPIRASWAFVRGYEYGVLIGEASMTDAEQEIPEASVEEVQAFCHGSVDGSLGDDWRLQIILYATHN